MKILTFANIKIFMIRYQFLIVYSLILMLLVSLPLIIGYAQQPASSVFTTVRVPDAGDYWVYFSRIEQSLNGGIFHRYLYSNEALPQIQFYPLWIVFGLIGTVLNLSSIATFNLLLILFVPVLVFSLHFLIKEFINDKFWQKLTVVFITLYSGLDWILWPLFKKYFNYLGLDINLTDTHVFTSIFHSPHLTACLILMCWLFYLLLKLEKTNNVIYSWLAGLSSAFLFLSHPYQIPTIALSLLLYYGFTVIRAKNYKFIYKLLPFILINLVVAFYLFWLWDNFLVLKLWNSQNQILKFLAWYQSLILILSAIGVPFLLSLLYSFKNYKNNLLLYCWLVGTLVSIFLPIGWAIKSILGITIPLIILSCKYLSSFNYQQNLRLIIIFFFIFFVPSNAYLVFANINNYQNNNDPAYFLPNDLYAAIIQLKALPPPVTVLALPQISITIPALANQQIFCGHFNETINFLDKCRQANDFFKHPTKEFLLKNNITHVFLNNENTLDNKSFLELVFKSSNYSLYKVVR